MGRPFSRSRHLRIAKRVGVVLCVSTVALWCVTERYTGIVLPYWLVLFVALPPTALLCCRDRRPVPPGLCHTCGYDLRASKKRCPECGTEFAQQEREA